MTSLDEDLRDIYSYQFREDFAAATQKDHDKVHGQLLNA